jgi:hypothetical protein
VARQAAVGPSIDAEAWGRGDFAADSSPTPVITPLKSVPLVQPITAVYTLEVTYQILDSNQAPMSGPVLANIEVAESFNQVTGTLNLQANAGTWFYLATDGITFEGQFTDYLSAGGISGFEGHGTALQNFTASGVLSNGFPLVAQPLQVIGFGPVTPVLYNVYGRDNVTLNGYGLGRDPSKLCQ